MTDDPLRQGLERLKRKPKADAAAPSPSGVAAEAIAVPKIDGAVAEIATAQQRAKELLAKRDYERVWICPCGFYDCSVLGDRPYLIAPAAAGTVRDHHRKREAIMGGPPKD
jgi:hypothetical protein